MNKDTKNNDNDNKKHILSNKQNLSFMGITPNDCICIKLIDFLNNTSNLSPKCILTIQIVQNK